MRGPGGKWRQGASRKFRGPAGKGAQAGKDAPGVDQRLQTKGSQQAA